MQIIMSVLKFLILLGLCSIIFALFLMIVRAA